MSLDLLHLLDQVDSLLANEPSCVRRFFNEPIPVDRLGLWQFGNGFVRSKEEIQYLSLSSLRSRVHTITIEDLKASLGKLFTSCVNYFQSNNIFYIAAKRCQEVLQLPTPPNILEDSTTKANEPLVSIMSCVLMAQSFLSVFGCLGLVYVRKPGAAVDDDPIAQFADLDIDTADQLTSINMDALNDYALAHLVWFVRMRLPQ